PCTLAALMLVVVLTLQQEHMLDIESQANITRQLTQLSDALMQGGEGTPQFLLDRSLQQAHGSSLRRIELHQIDGQVLLYSGASSTHWQPYRQDLRDATGQKQTLILQVDPRPLQRAHWRFRLCGALIGIGIVLLAFLAASALRRRILAPLQELQVGLDELLAGRVPVVPAASSSSEFERLIETVQSLSEHRHNSQPRQTITHDATSDHLSTDPIARNPSQFVAWIGHHFRQPLQALELLTASLRPDTDADQRIVLTQMRDSIGRMTRLLDALLEISRLDAGVITTTSSVFSTAELFLRDRAAHNIAAARQGTTLRWHGIRYRLLGDSTLAASLLGQLLSNAIANTPHGCVLVAARRRGTAIRIEVRDNGPGISTAHQQYIFEEFTQLSHDTGQHPEGYGLGLAIAERLAELLGTRIGLRSAPGRGSTFWFELPRVSISGHSGNGDVSIAPTSALKHAC
ncbi:MAG: HAMP domain-containing sensor histidine kinase, partial [Rhodanobacter sp.]